MPVKVLVALAECRRTRAWLVCRRRYLWRNYGHCLVGWPHSSEPGAAITDAVFAGPWHWRSSETANSSSRHRFDYMDRTFDRGGCIYQETYYDLDTGEVIFKEYGPIEGR
jgi:hypothetical protein